MPRSTRLAYRCLATIALVAIPVAASAQTAAPAPAKKKVLQVLKEADLQPSQLVPPPPAPGSAAEKADLAELRRIVEAASPERLAQARVDDKHEDPSIFDETLGVSLQKMPATWTLLTLVHSEANYVANSAKEYFHRVRPWAVDTTLPNCDAGTGKPPTRSYPSGHSTLSYSVGFMLASLVPEKSASILDKARDYALSREVCGVHYPSDTEASHVIASVVATRLLVDPAMHDRIEAARAELRAAGLTKS